MAIAYTRVNLYASWKFPLENFGWFDYLVTLPFFQSGPREIIGLYIIVSKYNVFAVNHLLDLSKCNTITLRTERHNSLRVVYVFVCEEGEREEEEEDDDESECIKKLFR